MRSSAACMLCAVGCAFLILVSGYVTSGLADRNGELTSWYMLETCYNPDASFDLAGVGSFDVHAMRDTSSALPGTACPISSAPPAPPVDIALESSDGFRFGGAYDAVLLVASGSYATISFSVLDSAGKVLLPAANYFLGPDDAYPWAAPAADILPVTAASNFSKLPCGQCVDTCSSANDGVCDDGGSGAEFGVCAFGQDCGDCGSRNADGCDEEDLGSGDGSGGGGGGGRRLLFARSDGQPEMWSAVAALPAAGGRRLLKGGSSGGGFSAGGRSSVSGGRTSTRGAGAWGAATPTTRAGASPAMATTVNGRVYGGAAAYSVRGRSYYGAATPYNYLYGRQVFYMGAAFYVIGPGSHGCYSCTGASRSRAATSGCTSRQECGGVGTTTAASSLDRYQIQPAAKLVAPDQGSAQWPLTLRVHNVSTFLKRPSPDAALARGSAVYINWFTADGDAFDSGSPLESSTLLPLGYLSCIIFTYCLCKHKKELFEERRRPRRPPQRGYQQQGQPLAPRQQNAYGGRGAPQGQQMMPVAHPLQPTQGYPVPVAVPQGVPVATAHAARTAGGAYRV